MNLAKLNKEQKEAVKHKTGPLLIVAGAGTGKTTVIAGRIAYLVSQKKAKPEEILALTFTDKAAGEMEERVDGLLSLGYADLWISTFHSFCERVLRERGLDIGLPTNFKVVDQTSSWLLVRQNIDRFKLKYYKPLGNPTKFIHALIGHFSRLKDQGISPRDYLQYSKGEIEEKEKISEITRTYRLYQKLLLEKGLLDFGDLLNYCRDLFKERPAVLEKFRKQFKYILVDEFQDTNFIQYELVKMIASPQNNITVCADDDQAIYRWRGASFSNIIQFRSDFPEAKTVALVRNYRSCQNILDMAYSFIQANNPNRLEVISRLDKKLIAAEKCKGEIEHLHYKTADQEVSGVALTIAKMVKEEDDTNFSDFAILVRANESANVFARGCERAGIPFKFLALKGLYSKPVILDIISYFKLLKDHHEGGAMYRTLSSPVFHIPPQDIARISQYAFKRSKSLYEALNEIPLIYGLSDITIAASTKLLSLMEKHAQNMFEKNVSEIFISFLEDSGYLEGLVKRERREDLNYIGQFFSKIKAFEDSHIDASLKNFMEELDLELESGEEGRLDLDSSNGGDFVRIMTVHSAKGLEFKHVFLVSLVDRKFPTNRRSEQIEIPPSLIKDVPPEGDVHLQEERRLFYVAMTRAKRSLFFTSASDYGGQRPKKISQFLMELGYQNDAPQQEVRTVRINNRKPVKELLALPAHFSFTQLATFAKCPLQYKFAHILKIPTKGRAFFSFGKTIHNTLHEFVLETSQGAKPALKRLTEFYHQNWIDEWYDDKKEKEQYWQSGLKALEFFYRDFTKTKPQILDIGGYPALEQGFNLKIAGYTINGKIDRIDRLKKGEEIIDYKTGSAKEKLRPEDKHQLLIYQIASREVFGLEPQKLTYFYLEQGKRVSFLGTDEDLETQKQKILEQIEKIKRSNFRATPGWQCDWCDFRHICEFAKK